MSNNRLRAITQATLDRLGFNHGFLFIADEHSPQLHAAESVGYALSEIDITAWLPHVQEALEIRSGFVRADWLPEELTPGYTLDLAADGRQVGVLLCVKADLAGEPDFDAGQVANACEKLALAVHITYLKRQSERRLRQLQLISRVNQRITPLITGGKDLRRVVQAVRDDFDFYHTSILLVDSQKTRLKTYVAAGEAASELTEQDMTFLADGKGLTSWVLENGEAVLVNDVTQEERYLHVSHLPNTRAEAVVPIKVGDQTIGVLDVQSDRINAFDFVDLLALQIVANQVAYALDNDRLLKQERRRRQMIQTLQESVRVISSSLELDRVLDLILRELGRVVTYDNVRLKRVEDDVAQVIAARGFRELDSVMGTTYLVSENTLASMIVYKQKTVNIADITKDPRWIWLPGTKKIRSWIGVPLVMKDRVVGLLSVSRLELWPFTNDEAEMVNSFADQAAIAIENARLYNELKEFSATLEARVRERTTELERARKELADVLGREVEVQEKERIRIANELHDSVIQALIATNFQLQSVKLNLGREREILHKQLSEVQQGLDRLVTEIKAVVHDLRPAALESLGLVHAIRQLVAQFHDPPLFSVHLRVLGSVRPLNSSTERTIYRVVQEALSNSRMHSGAEHFKCTLVFEATKLEVILRDDGAGFHPEAQKGKGLGLVTMHDRARSSGGNLSIRSSPNKGTRIELSLPIENIPEQEAAAE